jgi:hypothetical protein
MAVSVMSNISIAMQSALAATKTITAISKAAPGVLTATHDFLNGDYVYLSIVGMNQLNGRVFRVCNIATTVSFQLEDVSGGAGISTLGYDTFVSGTAQKITFGVSVINHSDVKISGGDTNFIDATPLVGNQKVEIPGSYNAFKVDLELMWDPTDVGQKALKASSDAQSLLAYKITFGTAGKIMVFVAYAGVSNVPQGSALNKIVTPANIAVYGIPTYYGS